MTNPPPKVNALSKNVFEHFLAYLLDSFVSPLIIWVKNKVCALCFISCIFKHWVIDTHTKKVFC